MGVEESKMADIEWAAKCHPGGIDNTCKNSSLQTIEILAFQN
jgi:hypothetical protein